MRVAIVHSFYDRAQSSGENEVVLAQKSRLERAGVDVKLIARYTDEEKTARLYPLRAALGAANIAGPSPAAELEAFQPDIVHVHNLFPNWGTKWIHSYGDRLVVTMHNYRMVCANALMWRDGSDCQDCLVQGSRASLKNKCYRNSVIATVPLAIATREGGKHQPLLRGAAAIVALNSGAGELFSGLSQATVRTVPNFVPAVKPGGAEPHGRFLYVGRLTPEKGVARLISQLEGDYTLDVIGDGPDLPAVRDAAEGSSARVNLLGQRSHDEVLALMAQAQGLVIPSLWSEGIPTTALEALSCGTPVIVSSLVASARDLTAEGAGLIYDPAEPAAVNAALERVAHGRDQFSNCAIALHASNFSPEAWTRAMLDLYRDVIRRGTREGRN